MEKGWAYSAGEGVCRWEMRMKRRARGIRDLEMRLGRKCCDRRQRMWDPGSLISSYGPIAGRKSAVKQPVERYRFADAWYGDVWVVGFR